MGLRFTNNSQVSHGDIAEIDGATKLTLSVYIRLTSAANSVIASKGTGVAASFVLGVNSTRNLTITLGDGTNTRTGTGNSVLNVDTWYHVAWVYDGSQSTDAAKVKLYLNGTQETLTMSGTAASFPSTLQSNPNNLLFGYNGTTQFNGDIANVKIWDIALSPIGILEELKTQWPAELNNLVLVSPYNEYPLAIDYSGNNYNGTLTNVSNGYSPNLVSSSVVNDDDYAQALQYNNLRADVLAHGARHQGDGNDPIPDIVDLRKKLFIYGSLF